MAGAYLMLSCRYLRRNIIIAQRARLLIYHDPICSRAAMEMPPAKLGFGSGPTTVPAVGKARQVEDEGVSL